jgi:alpha(1,3/1,4) fucosyltransferase
MNFAPDFLPDRGFFMYLMKQAYGDVTFAETEEDADLVFTSVFGKRVPSNPGKSVGIIFENIRPNFDHYDFAITSDFDDYGGRNARCPFWFTQLQWPEFRDPLADGVPDNEWNHGFEPLLNIDHLIESRNPIDFLDREKFCCFVAGNTERHRLHAAVMLSTIGAVEIFGNVAFRPLKPSKLEVLSAYRYNICFENSLFPGYYTEKLLHAWAAGCVPIYFSDHLCREDFNPRAFVNRGNFPALRNVVSEVQSLEDSRESRAQMLSEPLLIKRPRLDPVIDFLRSVHDRTRGI